MSQDNQWIDANLHASRNVPRLGLLFLALIVLGAIGIFLGMGEGLRAMQAYWVNFIFFTGLAQGGVILTVIVNIARGKWGGPMVRLGLLNVSFVVVTMVLYIGIIFISGDLVPWFKHPLESKNWWLEPNFFLWRIGIGLALVTIGSLYFAYRTVRPEAGAIAEKGDSSYPKFLYRNWHGYEEEKAKSKRILRIFSPVLVFVFALVYSFVGFDLIMSLDPHWFSTLFGAYFFITCIYMGMATVIIVATLLRKPLGLEDTLNKKRFHDMGKLLFAFCILSTDFLWSQFLVIWYGDLPEENIFILKRISEQPWTTLSWVILLFGFVIPFILLLNKKIKTIPTTISIIALIILIGGFFERAVMILRSIYPEAAAEFPIGIVEVLISFGFLGIYGAVLFWTLRRVPVVPEDSYIAAEH